MQSVRISAFICVIFLLNVCTAIPLGKHDDRKRQEEQDDDSALEGLQLLFPDEATAVKRHNYHQASSDKQLIRKQQLDEFDQQGLDIGDSTDDLQLWLPETKAIRNNNNKVKSTRAKIANKLAKKDASNDDPQLQLFDPDSAQLLDTDLSDVQGIDDRDYGGLFGWGGNGKRVQDGAQKRERTERWMEAIGLGNYGGSSSQNSYGGGYDVFDDDKH